MRTKNSVGIYRLLLTVAVVLSLPAAGLVAEGPQSGSPPTAPRLPNLGDYSHKITTDSDEAQEYFDQGLKLHYGFNHYQAIRSFEQAQELDPDCAMAYWGEALSRGPHLNSVMARSNVEPAWEAIARAKELAATGSEKEQDFIDALAARYSSDPGASRGRLNAAYVESMRELANKYPGDPDAQALFAEALMVTSKWDYWEPDGSPNAVGEEIVSTLEASFERNPNHPGTNHFYIHTVEPKHADRGEEAADRLQAYAPAIGHLLHMPSHIYIQVGRYSEASEANEKAVAVDREYHEKHGARGMYRISYMPHNSIYLCFTTAMEGRGERCLEAAEITRDLILEPQLMRPGYGSLTQGFALRYYAMARFGKWEAILGEAKPPEELLYPTAIWHYARGLAFIRKGSLDKARGELDQIEALSTEEAAQRMDVFGPNTARTLVRIAAKIVEGELAAAEGRYESAVEALREAVSLEDNLGYHEPPAWFNPCRPVLGAILLEADRAEEAEEIYREDLAGWPENGWSLFGLSRALEAQGKEEEAAEVWERFEDAWSRADVELKSSRL